MGIESIFQILMLLENRPYVSLNEMSSACEISKRQVFRYLNILSAHNISIYFDKKQKGYKLRGGGSLSFAKFSILEEVYFTSSLIFFMCHIHGESVFNDIFNRLRYAFKKESERIINNLINRNINGLSIQEFYTKLHFVIIEYAVEHKKPILIWMDTQEKVFKLQRPNLVFENQWTLHDLENQELKLQLSNIKKIDFIH